MKKILANDEAFQIQSGSGGVLTAPNVESGEKIIATRDWVDDEINKVSAYYITSNAQGDTFATEQALNAGPWFSGGQTRNPTRNDYAIVSDGTPARYIVTTVSEQGVPTWVKQYDISSDYDARNLSDLDKVYETWEEPLVGDGNRASNHCLIHFKPSVFGVSGNCVIRQFTIRTSNTETPSNAKVYAKLFLESDPSASLATSRPVKITAQDAYFTFTFDTDATLDSETWYNLTFHLGAEDTSDTKNVGLRLTSNFGVQQDIYYDGAPTYRPIVKVLFAPTDDKVAYKADTKLNDTWKCTPSTYEGQEIAIEVQENSGAKSLVLMVDGSAIGTAKPVSNGVSKVTWTKETDWPGDEDLVARLSYVLGDQEGQKLQPSGDYLTEEDFDSVEVLDFKSEKILVKDGGSLELGMNSTVNVKKGANDPKIVVEEGSTTHELDIPSLSGTIAVKEDIMDELNGREVTWEDDLNYNDQASGLSVLKFKPRAFGMPSGRTIKSIVLTNSRSTATDAEVYIKLMSADGQTTYATSDSQNMDTKNKAYTFTFDSIVGLDADTEYQMIFFLSGSDPEAQQGVNLNLKSGEQSPDLYLGTRTDLRPQAKVVYKNPPLYTKPYGGIPKSDLDSNVQNSLGKADNAATHEETLLTEAWSSLIESKWKTNPRQINGYDIEIRVVETGGVVKASAYANNAIQSMNSITITDEDRSITWNPMGGERPYWFGDVPLVATRTDKYLVLGEQTDKGIQPKGNYAVVEDLAQVSQDCATARQSATQALNKANDIESVIPQMEEGDQLASESFVNSSISTNTANYISNNGQPFASKAELDAYSGEKSNNDYAFVVGTDAQGNTTYTRYKYNANSTPPEWAEEYVLNNSSFTAAQWAAITSGITKGIVDKLMGYTTTWQDDITYDDQSAGIQKLLFKPRAFEMPDGAYINKMTLTNSPTTSTANEIVLKLMSVDEQTVYATSDAQNMDTQGQAYTFTFDTKYGLLKDTEYLIRFYLASTGAAVNVSLKLKSGTESPDLHLNTNRLDLRPKAVVEWGMDGAYLKPTNGIPESDLSQEVQNKLDGAYPLPSSGIPKNDLASGVQSSLDKADSAAQPEDVQLKESYGDPMDSEWTLNQTTIQGNDITLQITQDQTGAVKVTPWASGAPIADTGITITDESKTITWNPMGGQSPFWAGSEPLVGTRVGNKFYVLGNQKEMGLQPAGDYLSKEDLDEISVRNFTSEAIEVKDGGTIKLKPGSSIKVIKGVDEAKIVIDDGSTTKEVSFPEKNGTLLVDSDAKLNEQYGDILDSEWISEPTTIQGIDIVLEVAQDNDVVKITPKAGGQIIANTPITLQGDETTVTWNPMGGASPFWASDVPLVATRVVKYIKLGEQEVKLPVYKDYATKDMCVSKAALASVLDAVDAETGTDAKFNALITGLRNLVNA